MKAKLKYPSKTFFIADTHFGHASIINHCKRPFASVQEMDECLISNWNSIIKSGNTVYVLGDFAYKDHLKYLHRLNGQKILIVGNHDKMSGKVKECFSEIHPMLRRNFFKQDVTLCHYAMVTWANSIHGSWQLYGHSHGRLIESPTMKQLDVGVDTWNYSPVPFEVVKMVMDTKADKIIYPDGNGDPHKAIAENTFNHLGIWNDYDKKTRITTTRNKGISISS